VGLRVFECSFCKDILAMLRHRTFHEMNEFSVDILRGINVYFVASVYMDCLVFFEG
jgi:hypothetical protein